MTRARLLGAVTVLAVLVVAAACGATAAKPSASTSAPTTPGTPLAGAGTIPGGQAAPSDTTWLCKPGQAEDPCRSPLDTAAIAPDGRTTKVIKAAPAKNPPIDCFYVYPTVNNEPTVNSDLVPGPAETAVAVAQAARFSQVCNVYAPMYRQLTLRTITNRAGVTPAASALAFGDVRNAWADYLAHYNKGRPVVLIGHSQGAFQLKALISIQIDGDPAVRKLLVSALLLGGNITVPTGKDVGGDFKHIPACHSDTQNGCVVAYSSFLQPPPVSSLFGRSRAANTQVLCVNPAALGGGSATLHSEFPTTVSRANGGIVNNLAPGKTPWVTYPGLYKGQCTSANGATWLQITPTPAPGDTRPVVTQQLGPTWGTHLVDMNLTMEDMVELVRHEAAAHER
jgi:hypothetical protein